ncbi:MAG: hypothetical protein OEX07_13985 [Gammaproteobacteria bacterium]|nr:hypothetical protein [Gammaproteobacteria bacterium]
MKQRKSLVSLLFGMSALVSVTTTIADSNVQIHHAVTASQADSVSLSITIDNAGNEDLIGATLFASGNEFTAGENIQSILIGDLLANGQVIVEWTANAIMSASYFQSGLPVFFHLTATNNIGENIDISVHSLGGAK